MDWLLFCRYGMTETNVDQFLGAGYLNRSDAEFMKLALRGITSAYTHLFDVCTITSRPVCACTSIMRTLATPLPPLSPAAVLIADGDAGAGDLGGPPMSASDCSVLHADWPSQSPYVVRPTSSDLPVGTCLCVGGGAALC